jgi:hypothetical protein
MQAQGRIHAAMAQFASAAGLSVEQAGSNAMIWFVEGSALATLRRAEQSGRCGNGFNKGSLGPKLGTSEAEAQRILGEQEDVHGAHGVNCGTEALPTRLCKLLDESV